jgi:hypothetical protein
VGGAGGHGRVVPGADGVPNSVNLLRWGADAAPGCCRIEQWDYKADDRAFRLAKVSEVRPDRT